MLTTSWVVILVAIVALVIAVAAWVHAHSTRKDTDAITRKLVNLELDMDQCRNSLNRNRELLLEHESEHQGIQEAEDLQSRISRLKKDVEDLENRKQKLEEEVELLIKSLHEHREEQARLQAEIKEFESIKDLETDPAQNSDRGESVVKRRVIRKHRLTF